MCVFLDQPIKRGLFMSEKDVQEINNLYPCPSKGKHLMKKNIISDKYWNTMGFSHFLFFKVQHATTTLGLH